MQYCPVFHKLTKQFGLLLPSVYIIGVICSRVEFIGTLLVAGERDAVKRDNCVFRDGFRKSFDD